MSDELKRFPRVPVIGLQPRQVRAPASGLVISQAVVCDCGAPDPIMIPNVDRAGFCPTCKAKWVIAQVAFRNDNGLVSVEVKVGKWGGPMSASNELTVGLDAGPELGRPA